MQTILNLALAMGVVSIIAILGLLLDILEEPE